MSRRDPRNIPASVRTRLLNLARQSGEEFHQQLQYYAIERFLFRLSRTEWSDRLVVKGATMFRAWGTPLGRPTRDIDFLGRIDSSPTAIERVVRDCLAIEHAEDGIVFNPEIEVSEINVADRYPGIRAVIRGYLDGAVFRLQLDIGIDDAVVPEPAWVDYPTMLDLEAPRILAYLPVTALAEKFETIVSRGLGNSRLRDYYDLWLVPSLNPFSGSEVQAAFEGTFSHRGTAIPGVLPDGLSETFYDDAQRQGDWRAYIRGRRLAAPETLSEVCAAIADFVTPPSIAIARRVDFDLEWTPDSGWHSSP